MRSVGRERGRIDRVALITIVLLVVVIGGGYVFLRLTADDDSAKPAAQPTVKPSHHAKPQSSPSPTPTEPVYDANNPDVGKVVVVSSDHETTSDAVGIPYWADLGKGGVLHSGSTATPFAQRPATFTLNHDTSSTLAGSWIVLTVGSKPRLVWADAKGNLQRNLPGAPGGLVATPDGSQVAYLSQTGYDTGSSANAWSITSGKAQQAVDDPLSRGVRLDGFLSGGRVLFQPDSDHVAVWEPKGDATDLAGTYAAGGPSNPKTDRYAVKSSDACWGVAAYPKKPLSGWKTCYAAISGFSADGSKVVLTGDGYHFVKGSADDAPEGPATLWIRQAAGNAPVVVYTAPKGGFFTSWAWDGDVLDAVLYEPGTGKRPGTWSLLRLGAASYEVQDGLQAIAGDDPDSPRIVLPRG